MDRESERKRLVELIKDSLNKHIGKSCLLAENIASDLLANGIVVPPCKVGQTVYIITEVSKTIWEGTVIGIWQCASNTAIITEIGTIHNDSLGKTVFLTREEAEKMLKGSKNNG